MGRLDSLEGGGAVVGTPVELKSYKVFREALLWMLKRNDSPKIRTQIVRYLVRWVKVYPDGLKINWAIGENYVKSALISWGDAKIGVENDKEDFEQKKGLKLSQVPVLFSPHRMGSGVRIR